MFFFKREREREGEREGEKHPSIASCKRARALTGIEPATCPATLQQTPKQVSHAGQGGEGLALRVEDGGRRNCKTK